MRDEGVSPADGGLRLAADQRLGLGDGVGFRHQLGAVEGEELVDALAFLVGGGLVEQVFLGHVEHAVGAAGGIVEGRVPRGDGDVQQLNHQADDFTRGEVIPGRLGVGF